MFTGFFHFINELNHFLPKAERGKIVTAQFRAHQTVKDIIESLGVPHTEVGAITVNGRNTGFQGFLYEKAQVVVSPWSLKPAPLLPAFPSPIRFLIDVNLGKLARNLRLLGIDAAQAPPHEDSELVKKAVAENRILLTRDVSLLMRKELIYGYWVRSELPTAQTEEILKRFPIAAKDLKDRCSKCNGLIESVEKESIEDQLKLKTLLFFHNFFQCTACHQVYWKGSHYKKISELKQALLGNENMVQ